MTGNDEFVEIILDDEDEDIPPGDKAAVLRFSADPLSVEGFPDVLVEHLGMVRADAAKLCRTSGGVFLEDAEPAKARGVAEGLRDLGEECILVPASRLISLPRPLPVHSAALTAQDLGPADAAGRQDSAPWSDALILVMAHVGHEEVQAHTRVRLGRTIPGVGLAGAAAAMAVGSTRKTTTTRSSTRIFLQIVFDDPLRCYEIDSREFDYSILGDQLQHSSEANIQTLARWFLHACPHVRTNFARDRLMQTARAELPVSTPKGLIQIARWLVNLEKLAG